MKQTPGTGQIVRGLVIGIVLALVVLTIFTIVGDVRELGDSLSAFKWAYLLPIVGLTGWNYWWRFLKWEMYIEALDVPHIPRRTGIPIFLSGFSMSVTPGKVGEIIKAFYVRRETNAPIEVVTGALFAERATDALAMLVLAIVAATQFDEGRVFVGLLVVGAAIAIPVLRHPRAIAGLIALLGRLPFADRFIHLAESFFRAARQLLSSRMLLTGTAMGVLSWLGECIAFFLVLVGLGLSASWSLLMIAILVLAVSSLAGGISMLPGGLGVADASVAGMLLVLVEDPKMTDAMAITATLLIRFATLWFAVLLGALMLLVLRRRPGAIELSPPTTASVSKGG